MRRSKTSPLNPVSSTAIDHVSGDRLRPRRPATTPDPVSAPAIGYVPAIGCDPGDWLRPRTPCRLRRSATSPASVPGGATSPDPVSAPAIGYVPGDRLRPRTRFGPAISYTQALSVPSKTDAASSLAMLMIELRRAPLLDLLLLRRLRLARLDGLRLDLGRLPLLPPHQSPLQIDLRLRERR